MRRCKLGGGFRTCWSGSDLNLELGSAVASVVAFQSDLEMALAFEVIGLGYVVLLWRRTQLQTNPDSAMYVR